MSATAETIHEYFEQYGWPVEFDDETSTWRTGFRGHTANFAIVVHLTDNWVYFVIDPFVNAPADVRCASRLHQHLLRLNHAINMAKFSVDDEGDVVLTVELPTENLDYSEFADGINALSYYADAYYLDVVNTAHKPGYVPGSEDYVGGEGDLGWEAN